MQRFSFVNLPTRPKEIKGLKRIGRGMCSIVYDKGDTVIKITSDPATKGFLTEQIVDTTGIHFPKVIKDYGYIGTKGDRDLYMVEVEKLYPNRSKEKKDLIKQWEGLFDEYRSARNYVVNDLQRAELMILPKITSTETIREALDTLNDFMLMYDCFVDLAPANIMARKDGTLVFSDPVVDRGLSRWK